MNSHCALGLKEANPVGRPPALSVSVSQIKIRQVTVRARSRTATDHPRPRQKFRYYFRRSEGSCQQCVLPISHLRCGRSAPNMLQQKLPAIFAASTSCRFKFRARARFLSAVTSLIGSSVRLVKAAFALSLRLLPFSMRSDGPARAALQFVSKPSVSRSSDSRELRER